MLICLGQTYFMYYSPLKQNRREKVFRENYFGKKLLKIRERYQMRGSFLSERARTLSFPSNFCQALFNCFLFASQINLTLILFYSVFLEFSEGCRIHMGKNIFELKVAQLYQKCFTEIKTIIQQQSLMCRSGYRFVQTDNWDTSKNV